MTNKQFNILLGDSSEFVKSLQSNPDFSCIFSKDHWILNKTTNNLFWIIGEEVTNLTHQFIIFKNPIIYIFFNYHVKNSLDIIQNFFSQVQRDLLSHQNKKYIIVGTNYQDVKSHKSLKKNILQWCISSESKVGPNNLIYSDLDDLHIIL